MDYRVCNHRNYCSAGKDCICNRILAIMKIIVLLEVLTVIVRLIDDFQVTIHDLKIQIFHLTVWISLKRLLQK